MLSNKNSSLTQCLFDETLLSPKLIAPTAEIPTSAEKLINKTYDNLDKSRIKINLESEYVNNNVKHIEFYQLLKTLENKISEIDRELFKIKNEPNDCQEHLINQLKLENKFLRNENDSKNEIIKILLENQKILTKRNLITSIIKTAIHQKTKVNMKWININMMSFIII